MKSVKVDEVELHGLGAQSRCSPHRAAAGQARPCNCASLPGGGVAGEVAVITRRAARRLAIKPEVGVTSQSPALPGFAAVAAPGFITGLEAREAWLPATAKADAISINARARLARR